jgi:hypothetical protein
MGQRRANADRSRFPNAVGVAGLPEGLASHLLGVMAQLLGAARRMTRCGAD